MTRESRPLERALRAEVAETCTASHLRRASRAISNLFDAEMRRSGLRVSQFNALAALAIAGEVPISRLAGLLALDRTTLTRNLRPLERQGLVAAAAGRDRRRKVLRITDQGRSALARSLPAWRRAQDRVLRHLGEARWKGLLRGLEAASAVPRSAGGAPG